MAKSTIKSAQLPDICARCASLDTISIITKKISGVDRSYFNCSACKYLWPAPIAA